MKPTEILSALPDWAEASSDQLLAAPAWTLPCRLGDAPGALRLDAIRPTDTLDLLVKFEDEEHVLGLADGPLFKELYAVWAARADIPEPILLALVEKECGPLLQLLENAIRRQLSIVGLAPAPAASDALCARVVSSGNDLATFVLSRSRTLVDTLGELRFIDIVHPSVRERAMSAEVEFASFALSTGDQPETGDALLLPEIDAASGKAPVRLVVDGRFAVSADTGVTMWSDDGRYRVVRTDRATIPFGALADLAAEKASWADIPVLAGLGAIAPETPLQLVLHGSVVASGRLVRLGESTAFALDAV